MKLVVKQLKKIDNITETIYQCVLEGADPSGIETVFGKLTLESGDPNTLNGFVKQAINAEVDIRFSQPQVTLESFVEQ